MGVEMGYKAPESRSRGPEGGTAVVGRPLVKAVTGPCAR